MDPTFEWHPQYLVAFQILSIYFVSKFLYCSTCTVSSGHCPGRGGKCTHELVPEISYTSPVNQNNIVARTTKNELSVHVFMMPDLVNNYI